MLVVYMAAPWRYREWVTKNRAMTVREATECLKEVEEEAQAMERIDLLVYSIYEGNQLVFRDEIPVGAGQSSNLLFLVQKALGTDLFVDEPEENKNKLLQQLAQEIRSYDPLPDDVQPAHHQRKISLIIDLFHRYRGKKKAPSETDLVSDGVIVDLKEETVPIHMETTHVRGAPFLPFLQTVWQYAQTGFRVGKSGAEKGLRSVVIWQRQRMKMKVYREKRKLKELDVKQEEAMNEQRLFEKLQRDREKMRKQVAADAIRQEKLAAEIRKAHSHWKGQSKYFIRNFFVAVIVLFGSIFLSQNPDLVHRFAGQATWFWNYLQTSLKLR
jgi:hypothetical protein